MIIALLVLILLAVLFPRMLRAVFLGLAAVVVFVIVMAASHAQAEALDLKPYTKPGIVSCALPGTTIEFALNGDGGAIVADLSSKFGLLLQAAEIKTWTASTVEEDGQKFLVLDSLNGTRIFIAIPDGKGFVFVTPPGAPEEEQGMSDILCQVLVQPD
jgi:hypothetical protein